MYSLNTPIFQGVLHATPPMLLLHLCHPGVFVASCIIFTVMLSELLSSIIDYFLGNEKIEKL
jgi:hypothetical protein